MTINRRKVKQIMAHVTTHVLCVCVCVCVCMYTMEHLILIFKEMS